MEEAYAELYREFLHLRSICMKQAALLGQLMETVKRLQGHSHFCCKCICCFKIKYNHSVFLTTTLPVALSSFGVASLLCHLLPLVFFSHYSPSLLPSSSASLAPQLPLPTQGPWMNSSFLNSEMLSQAGGFLMSEAALHSQVCEFCHAVFPGSSTTMGEFLRHLNTHIT
uniref:TRAF family member-associated NF-kappa-B activator-like n=1 Tax=Scleropages formosus TaxID=113540 RepID=A0A8C9SQJ0_SCLFO